MAVASHRPYLSLPDFPFIYVTSLPIVEIEVCELELLHQASLGPSLR